MESGKVSGYVQGQLLGIEKSFDIYQEIGYYLGLAQGWILSLKALQIEIQELCQIDSESRESKKESLLSNSLKWTHSKNSLESLSK